MKHFALSILLAGIVGVAHANPVLSIDPATQSVTRGDPVSFNIDIAGLGNGLALGTYDLSLSFDPSLLVYSGIQFGTQLDLFGLGDIQSVTPGTGHVEIFELSLDSAADLNKLQSSAFTLATVTFNTLATGLGATGLSVYALGDASGNAISAQVNGASVSINAVPLPPALLLFAGGLWPFIARRRTCASFVSAKSSK